MSTEVVRTIVCVCCWQGVGMLIRGWIHQRVSALSILLERGTVFPLMFFALEIEYQVSTNLSKLLVML
jgi:hypothetical protein